MAGSAAKFVQSDEPGLGQTVPGLSLML